MSTFTWAPDYGASKDKKPQVTQIKFGDSYEQRASFGINTTPQIWTLKFSTRTQSEADAIESFLDTCGGITSFQWTPPDQTVALTFVCREWPRSIDAPNIYSITATFEQVFEP